MNTEYYKMCEEEARLHEAVFGLVRVLLIADTQIGNVAEAVSQSNQLDGFIKENVIRLHNDRSFLKEGVKHLYTLITLTKNDNLNREEAILRDMLIDIERNRFNDIDRL